MWSLHHTIQKINFKWTENLSQKSKALSILVENIKYFYDLEVKKNILREKEKNC